LIVFGPPLEYPYDTLKINGSSLELEFFPFFGHNYVSFLSLLFHLNQYPYRTPSFMNTLYLPDNFFLILFPLCFTMLFQRQPVDISTFPPFSFLVPPTAIFLYMSFPFLEVNYEHSLHKSRPRVPSLSFQDSIFSSLQCSPRLPC